MSRFLILVIAALAAGYLIIWLSFRWLGNPEPEEVPCFV